MIEKVREIFKREAAAIANIPVTKSFETAVGIIHRKIN